MNVFRNITDAGLQLAEKILAETSWISLHPVVLGILKNGVSAGSPVAQALSCGLEAVPVRKLFLPMNDMTGFGAVTLEREIHLDENLVGYASINTGRIKMIIDKTYAEVMLADQLFRAGTGFPGLRGHAAVIVDDGLETGYSMLAAIKLARKKGADRVFVAVPAASRKAHDLVQRESHEIVCLNIYDPRSFSLRQAYQEFPDVPDNEIRGIIGKNRA